MAHEKEPKVEVAEFVKKFSSMLSMLKRDGVLTTYVVNGINQNTFWGSPKWLDEKGDIIKGHEYDKNLLAGQKGNEITI